MLEFEKETARTEIILKPTGLCITPIQCIKPLSVIQLGQEQESGLKVQFPFV